ncbi:MAG TPA: helix-turn-helix domain-containing protein [Thermoleophilia bacterium]|nr:helix-turn-helix domain-containing protein [Thermoleophilia bacterium]
MSRQENVERDPRARPRGRPRQTVTDEAHPGLPRDHPMAALPPTARSILEAARRVLAERGLEGLTIEAVANEANVSRTLIPYHFGSRAGLVALLFDSLFHDLSVSVYGLAGPGGSVRTFMDWIKEEAADLPSQRDFFELIVVALRERDLRRRIALLYDDYRELTLELAGVCEPDQTGRPAPAVPTDVQRRLDALGSVLVAIEDGIGLQAALDPGFDVDAALGMAEEMVADTVARLGRQSESATG